MVTIQVDEQTAERIAALAREHGVTAAEVLKRLIPAEQPKHCQADQLLAEIDQLSFDGPSLPTDFSRADIYQDHN